MSLFQIPWHAPEHYYQLYDPDLPVAPHQHLPSDMPDIAASNIFTTRYMDEESGRCSCFESSLYDGDKSCCGEFANANKSKKGTFTGNYTARSYWDSFADLHAMPKTDYFPHDNTTLAVKDQQRIRQACERSKPPAVPCQSSLTVLCRGRPRCAEFHGSKHRRGARRAGAAGL